jgi:hypothetical protein
MEPAPPSIVEWSLVPLSASWDPVSRGLAQRSADGQLGSLTDVTHPNVPVVSRVDPVNVELATRCDSKRGDAKCNHVRVAIEIRRLESSQPVLPRSVVLGCGGLGSCVLDIWREQITLRLRSISAETKKLYAMLRERVITSTRLVDQSRQTFFRGGTLVYTFGGPRRTFVVVVNDPATTRLFG